MNKVENLFCSHRAAERGEQRLPSGKNVFDFVEREALTLNVDVALAADHVTVGTRLRLITTDRSRTVTLRFG